MEAQLFKHYNIQKFGSITRRAPTKSPEIYFSAYFVGAYQNFHFPVDFVGRSLGIAPNVGTCWYVLKQEQLSLNEDFQSPLSRLACGAHVLF